MRHPLPPRANFYYHEQELLSVNHLLQTKTALLEICVHTFLDKTVVWNNNLNDGRSLFRMDKVPKETG
jgi:hypothetical protein